MEIDQTGSFFGPATDGQTIFFRYDKVELLGGGA